MTCSGEKILAHRNADKRVTYTPRGRNFSFSALNPAFTVRRGATVLLQVTGAATPNGSVFANVDDAIVLTLEKSDMLLLDSGSPDNQDEILSYDVVLTDGSGFENWMLGGPFVLLGLNNTGSCDSCGDVEVSINGDCVEISVEGGNIGVGASVLLADLNQAVEDAEVSADAAAASLAAVPGIAASAGATAGATAGASAGASAGTTAGTAAANAVLINKQDKTITAPLTGAVARLVNSKLADIFSVKDFGAVCDGTTDDTVAVQKAFDAIPDNARGAAVFFPGPTRITAKVSISRPSKTVCLYGNGVSSDILCDGRYAGIAWESTSNTDSILTVPQFMMCGLWITKTYEPTAGQSGETGLSVKWAGTGVVAGTDHLRLINGGIRTATGSAFWNVNLEIIDGGAASMSDFTFANFNGVDLTRTEALIKIIRDKALNCCRFQFTNCYGFRSKRGIKAVQTGAVQVGSIEAIYWTGGEMVGVGYGFESDAPGGGGGNFFSQFQFVNSHMDVTEGFVKGIVLNNLYVDNNFLIKSANGATPGDSNGFDISGGVLFGSITNNTIFQFNKAYGTGISDAISVSSTGASLGLFIAHNTISNWRRGVTASVINDANNIRISSDNVYNNVTSPLFIDDRAAQTQTEGFNARHILNGANSSELLLSDTGAASGARRFGLRYDDGKLFQRRLGDDGTTVLAQNRLDVIEASIVLDPPSVATGAQNFVDISCVGAAIGDYVQAAASASLQGCFLTGEVITADSVRVFLHNLTGGTVDLPVMTYYARVYKRA